MRILLISLFIILECCMKELCAAECQSDWKLVFVAVGGNGENVHKRWSDRLPQGCCKMKYGCLPENSNVAFIGKPKRHLKSKMIDRWGSLSIEKVKVEVYKDGERKVYFIFNGKKSDYKNWFTNGRLLWSSFKDLYSSGSPSTGCHKDTGWFVVLDQITGCPWELKGPKRSPAILYGIGNKKVIWQSMVLSVFGSHPVTTNHIDCLGTLCDNHKAICHIILRHGGFLTVDRIFTGQCISHCHYTMCHEHQVIPEHGCCCNDDHCVETIGQSHAAHASVLTTASTPTPLPTTTPVYCQNCQDLYNASCQTNGHTRCATGEACAFHRYASGRVETKCQLFSECETRRIDGIKYQSAEPTKCCMDFDCVAKTVQIFSQGALGSHPTTTSHVNCLGTLCDNHKPICHIIPKHGGLLIGQCINHCHYTTCHDYQTVPEHGCCCQNDHCVETIGQSHAAHASGIADMPINTHIKN